MSPDFREILTKSGPPAHVTPVPEAVREAYRGRVPDGLLDFWAELGWCSLEDGYYWVCDPRQFDGLLADVFRGDPEFDPADFTIFQYDSFGKLYGWRNDTYLISLSLAGYKANFSAQSMDRRPETAERWSDDRLVANAIALAREAREHAKEQDLNDFEYALKTLGSLAPGEIYVYVPAFALGGTGALGTLAKAPIREHLLMLSQLVTVEIQRYVFDMNDTARNPMGRRERVRDLGPQR